MDYRCVFRDKKEERRKGIFQAAHLLLEDLDLLFLLPPLLSCHDRYKKKVNVKLLSAKDYKAMLQTIHAVQFYLKTKTMW